MAKIGIISLGCPRNLVDSESILGLLKEGGNEIVDMDVAQVGIVNTCSFIEDARMESIDTIMELINLKKEGKLKGVIVAGCLPQRYKEKLSSELSEVDGFVGVGDLGNINAIVENTLRGKKSFHVSAIPQFKDKSNLPKLTLTLPHYRYIKIQEGCGNKCSYCVIPQIKGPLSSRPMESILDEIGALPPEASEINIVGQDITTYGLDLYKELKLVELINKISGIRKSGWIRLLYAHPARVGGGLINTIKASPNICKYLDLPLQHINDRILKQMNRRVTKRQTRSLVEKLRKEIPGLAIRTSFLVGFPGESEKEFKELVDFVKEMKFERLGVFKYSREEGTDAAALTAQVPEKVKQARFDEIMNTQKDISLEINRGLLGKVLQVLIDEPQVGEPGLFLGRTQHDAPEVDGQVWVKSKKANPGKFIKVKITDTLEYDLVGEEV